MSFEVMKPWPKRQVLGRAGNIHNYFVGYDLLDVSDCFGLHSFCCLLAVIAYFTTKDNVEPKCHWVIAATSSCYLHSNRNTRSIYLCPFSYLRLSATLDRYLSFR